ncbi:MAG TPA: DUF305 domain-containing protein [Longimicrobiales bacterium]
MIPGRIPPVVLMAVLAAAACSSATTPSPAPQSTNSSADEFEAIYRARQDSARMHYTDADVRFMRDMIHHHAQAIEMSQLVPARTNDPAMRTLAGRIINAQRAEIATMQRWLRNRGLESPEVHITDTTVMVHGTGHEGHGLMPGMITPEQMRELAAARGTAFHRLFLTFMIQHHNGAVKMVYDLFDAGAGQDEDAFRLASDVQVDQITEVRRMEQMLAALPGDRMP